MATNAVKAWFLDDEPSRRFPVYCRGNVGEIVPDVATPLTATITIPAFRTAFAGLFSSTGTFTEAELAEPAATGGLFGGYLYFNASFARTLAGRLPGLRVDDVDRQLFGGDAGAVPPHRRGPGDRSPRTAARAIVGLTRTTLRGMPIDLDGDRIENDQWLASLPASPTADQVVSAARSFTARFERHLLALLISSLGVGMSTAILERIAGRAERAEPGLLVKAMSGLGTIETAEPSVALWELGRMVAASPALTALFDAGVDGLPARLRSSVDSDDAGDDVGRFAAAFDAFLVEHGHRGPKEVELLSETWATAPASALALVDRLRMTSASADPVRAGARLAAERDDARHRLRMAVVRPLRPLVDRLLVRASEGTARREQAKGTMVRALSGLRTMLFHLSDEVVARGGLGGRKDVFMATIDELAAVARDPKSYASVLADRRRRYDELNALAPPFAFEGTIPDPSTWSARGAAASSSTDGDELVGIGAASGVARGRVRIVTDPADPRGLEPGEVLVAPLTDPAWTPLFLAAVAVVVDVGALQSHAAIVARELGIPAVVSVAGATSRLADGDLVEVDGNRGTVRRIA
jgi:pyruvate,water dikinase